MSNPSTLTEKMAAQPEVRAALAALFAVMVGGCAAGQIRANADTDADVNQDPMMKAANDMGLPAPGFSVSVDPKTGEVVFSGMGCAENISNPAILRTNADNRARAALGKGMARLGESGTFISEKEAVTKDARARRSFMAALLSGVEIVDHAPTPSGVCARADLRRSGTRGQ